MIDLGEGEVIFFRGSSGVKYDLTKFYPCDKPIDEIFAIVWDRHVTFVYTTQPYTRHDTMTDEPVSVVDRVVFKRIPLMEWITLINVPTDDKLLYFLDNAFNELHRKELRR